jgi:diadenosine tetraphosphate (Ap4A) HIT family hydrolase
MLYHDHLKASPQDKHCPFCHFEEKNIITQSKYFYITFARAPYAPDHILIIPKRHVILLKELKKAERKELRSLTEERNEKLKQNHTSTSILIRDTLP